MFNEHCSVQLYSAVKTTYKFVIHNCRLIFIKYVRYFSKVVQCTPPRFLSFTITIMFVRNIIGKSTRFVHKKIPHRKLSL